jgi:hypothetical protein
MQETKEEASLCVASSRNVLNAATAPPKECPAGMFWMYQLGGFCQLRTNLQPRTIHMTIIHAPLQTPRVEPSGFPFIKRKEVKYIRHLSQAPQDRFRRQETNRKKEFEKRRSSRRSCSRKRESKPMLIRHRRASCMSTSMLGKTVLRPTNQVNSMSHP